MRSRSCSHVTSSASPYSSCAALRSVSADHSRSTSASSRASESRLASRPEASSTRSSAGSVSACSRSVSAALVTSQSYPAQKAGSSHRPAEVEGVHPASATIFEIEWIGRSECPRDLTVLVERLDENDCLQRRPAVNKRTEREARHHISNRALVIFHEQKLPHMRRSCPTRIAAMRSVLRKYDDQYLSPFGLAVHLIVVGRGQLPRTRKCRAAAQ
jgi:hypothetical protein